MREQLLALHALQTVDSGILEIQKERETIPQRLNEIAEALDTLRTEVGGLRSEAATKTSERQALEATLHDEQAKVKKWDSRLNEIRTPREYQALSREIEIAKRQNQEAEEQILQLSIELDDLNKAIEEKAAVLADAEARAAEEEAGLKKQLAAFDKRLTEKSSVRDSKLAAIPPAVIKRYETIRARRFGIAVVPAVDGICRGCNMNIPPQLFIELQRNESLHTCPSCSRILFWDGILEDESAEDSQEPEQAKRAG